MVLEVTVNRLPRPRSPDGPNELALLPNTSSPAIDGAGSFSLPAPAAKDGASKSGSPLAFIATANWVWFNATNGSGLPEAMTIWLSFLG